MTSSCISMMMSCVIYVGVHIKSANFLRVGGPRKLIYKNVGFVASSKFKCLENLYVYSNIIKLDYLLMISKIYKVCTRLKTIAAIVM